MSNDPDHKNAGNADTPPTAEPSASPVTRRSWVMRHKLLTLVAIFLLAALAHYLVTRPMDNPKPQKRLLVQGSFPYDRGWDLKIEASYYSRNPTCKQTARAFFLFPQSEVSREAWRTVPVVRQQGNRYRFEFFEDAVLQGFCDWQLRFLNYSIFHDGREIQGEAILGFPSRDDRIRYDCKSVSSTYFKAPDRTPVIETGVVCRDRDRHQKDPARSDYQIDFVWEEPKS